MTARLGQFEPLDLPKGERLIWQGRPLATALAFRVFHMRLVAFYFALLFAARIAIGGYRHQPWLESVAGASRLLVPFAARHDFSRGPAGHSVRDRHGPALRTGHPLQPHHSL